MKKLQNLDFKSAINISPDNLDSLQLIMLSYLFSKNNSCFSESLSNLLDHDIESKNNLLMTFITNIESFTNGIMFEKGTKTSAENMITPFNNIIEPFLKDKEHPKQLIRTLTELDKGYLEILKQSLWGVLIRLY